MPTIEIILASDRNRVGRLILKDDAGRKLAGPYSVCGRANDFAASEHRNPTRSPLQPYGDTPTGEYRMRGIVRTGRGTAYDATVFGKFGMIALEPVRGQAAIADQNGRHVLVIHAGTPNPASRLLYATNGSVRMYDDDLRELIEALRGESSVVCKISETNEFATSLTVTLDPTYDEGDPPLLAQDQPKPAVTPSAALAISLKLPKIQERLISPHDEAYSSDSSSGDSSSDSGDSSSSDNGDSSSSDSGGSSSGDSSSDSGDSSSSDSGDSSSSDSGDSSSGDSSSDSGDSSSGDSSSGDSSSGDSSSGDSSSGDSSSGDSSSGDSSSGDSNSGDSSGSSSSSSSSGKSGSSGSSSSSGKSSSSGSSGSSSSSGSSGSSGSSSSSSGGCSITGITPTNASLFAGEPQLFTAQGSNLGEVNWTTSASANPATGTGASFTTRWSATGNQTVTATCGGVTKTVTVAVHSLDIQINNTTATNDDLVVLNSTHPAQQFNVNCQMRLQGPSVGNVTVVLSNPDGRLRFPGPGNTTVNLTLDAAGAFSPFTISGNAASAAIGDAVIHIALTNGSEITTKNVTVVSFDQGSMQLTQGNAYNFVGPAATAVSYAAAGNLAVSFSSSARLRPAGVDCTVPQLKDLRMAIMQETSAMDFETTWDTPTIAFTGATQPVTVPATRRSTRVFDPAVAQPINDGFNLATDHAFPLYSKLAAALQPPSGCSGSAAAQSTDGPNHPTSPTSQLPIQDGTGATIATVTWTNRINTTRVQNFRTFCAVFNQVSNAFFSLREATWSLNTDSAAAAPQLASVNADAPAAANPTAVAPQANSVAQPETFSAVGGAKKSFP